MSLNSYVIASIRWLSGTDEPLIQVLGNKITITGYRVADGIGGLFSVVVEFLDVPSTGARDSKTVKIYPLVNDIESRLPNSGETFVLTAGVKPVAECTVETIVKMSS